MSDENKISRRKYVYAGAGVVVVAAAAGAGYYYMQKPSPGETPSPTGELAEYLQSETDWKQLSGQKVNIVTIKSPAHDKIKEVSPIFKQLTGIEVTYDTYTEREYWDKIVIAAQAKSGVYNVLPIIPAQGPTFIMQGWAENLSPFTSDPKLYDENWYKSDDIWPMPLSWGKFNFSTNEWGNGDQYMYPFIPETIGILYYRKDIFEDQGVSVPKTLQELYEVAEQLHGNLPSEMSAYVTRGCRMAGTWNVPLGYMYSYGANLYDEEWYPAIDKPEAIEAVDLYTKTFREFGPPGAAGYSYSQALDTFISGNAAMYLDSTALLPAFYEEASTVADTVGFAPWPSGPNGAHPSFLTWTWGVDPNPDENTRKAAFLFNIWVTSIPTTTKFALMKLPMPRKSVMDDPEVTEVYDPDYLAAFNHGMSNGVRMPLSLISGKAQDLMSTHTSKVIAGEMTAEEACKAVAELLQKEQEDAGYYTGKYGKFDNGGPVIQH